MRGSTTATAIARASGTLPQPPARGTPRAGTVELAVPKLRQGSYFPHWLLERRCRAEQALISVGVNADGHREILGLDVAIAEDGAGRPSCAP